MKKIFIINAHEEWPFSAGKLNQSLVDLAKANLEAKGYEVRTTNMKEPLDVERQIENHVWADAVILQTPCNWMGVPWSFKKYMDTVYTAGMDGRFSNGDGRTQAGEDHKYGMGGTLTDTKYMLSVTFNAPRDSFNNPDLPFFKGAGVDELFLPTHLNFRFFGMTPLETFASYDVLKNPDIENDFKRYTAHLDKVFPPVS